MLDRVGGKETLVHCAWDCTLIQHSRNRCGELSKAIHKSTIGPNHTTSWKTPETFNILLHRYLLRHIHTLFSTVRHLTMNEYRHSATYSLWNTTSYKEQIKRWN